MSSSIHLNAYLDENSIDEGMKQKITWTPFTPRPVTEINSYNPSISSFSYSPDYLFHNSDKVTQIRDVDVKDPSKEESNDTLDEKGKWMKWGATIQSKFVVDSDIFNDELQAIAKVSPFVVDTFPSTYCMTITGKENMVKFLKYVQQKLHTNPNIHLISDC